jgi:pseudouridine-5'-phosphate glycosidase
VLLAVPVPAKDELPTERVEAVILQATAEAAAQGIHGKRVTPFLLGRVAELTGGESRRANLALLINNARVGGQLAVALCALENAGQRGVAARNDDRGGSSGPLRS